jgi:steroid delta-isomerase-like uncharacterized protein
MSSDIKALSRQWFEKVWNQRDEAAIDQLAASDIIVHGIGESLEPMTGTQVFREFRRNFLSAFPDMTCNVEDVICEGDKTVTRVTVRGTHTGDGIGIAPTKRRFRASALVMFHWRNGKIAEGWNEFDAAGMMRQLQTR